MKMPLLEAKFKQVNKKANIFIKTLTLKTSCHNIPNELYAIL